MELQRGLDLQHGLADDTGFSDSWYRTSAEPVAVPVVGDLRSVRLDDYHRLDVRASRRFARERSVLELFIDIQGTSWAF